MLSMINLNINTTWYDVSVIDRLYRMPPIGQVYDS